MTIAENVARVRERMEAASRRAGRDPRKTRLVAVSKTVDPDRIREAIEAGVTSLGENYVQKAQKKISYEEAFKRCKAFMDKEKGSLGAGTTSDANKSTRGAACMKKFGHKL